MTLEEIVKIIGLKNTIALARVIKALSNVLRNKDFLLHSASSMGKQAVPDKKD